MNHFKAPIALLSAAALFVAGCSVADPEATDPATSSSGGGSTNTSVAAADFDLAPAAVMADNADYTTVNTDEWDESDAVDLDLSGGTVTITQAGVYRLSGTLSGQVIVEAPDDALVVLVLAGVDIANDSGPAIEVRSADDVAIHLAEGSTNTVSDAASYAEDADANAAIWADTDLTISGTGSLTVTANGNDGITSKDDLVILDGTITVTAADDALRGKKAMVVEGGLLTLTATAGDGLKADEEDDWSEGYIYVTGGTIDITAGDDGLQAQTDTVIAGGTITAAVADDGVKGEVTVAIGAIDGVDEPVVTVTESTEAVEAANIGISAGVVDLTASDDGINASGNAELQALMAGEEYVDDGRDDMSDTGERLVIAGGEITIDAEGDGIDSNGSLTFTGGSTVVYGPTRSGNGGLDANGEVTITGGTVLSFSGGGMEETPSGEGQGWVLIGVQLGSGQSGEIVDDSGATVVEFTSRKQASTVFYSSDAVTSGASYSATSDGSTLGTATPNEGGFGGMGGGMGGGQRPGGGMGGGQMPGGADGERPEMPGGGTTDNGMMGEAPSNPTSQGTDA